MNEMVGRMVPLDMAIVPEGSTTTLNRFFDITKRNDLLVREVDARINGELDGLVKDGRVTRKGYALALDGPSRCGKTAVLYRLIEQRRKAGWLVLFFRSGNDWTCGRRFFNPAFEPDEEVTEETVPLYYDRPHHTQELLKSFRAAHKDILSSLKASNDTRVKAEMKGSTLLDMTNFGLELLESIDEDWENIPRKAGDVLEALIEELIGVKDVPVMIAADNFDSFFGVSALYNRHNQKLLSQVFRASWPFGLPRETANRMQNGVCVVARSKTPLQMLAKKDVLGGCRSIPITDQLVQRIRTDPFDRKHVNFILKGITMEIPRWTQDEASALLTYINDIGFVAEKFRKSNIQYYHSLTQGNPEEMVMITKSM